MATIGWAIVGCGNLADRRIAPAIRAAESARLVAFCSRNLGRAADFARRHGADRAYNRLGELADDTEVQAVYVATTNASHRDIAIALLEAGKHVLCEEPLALTAADAETMIDAARSAKLNLGVACRMRYLPALARVNELVTAGKVGQVIVLRAGLGYVFPPSDAWRQDPKQAGGGPLMDLAPQVIDVLRWLAGEVVAAHGVVGNARFNYRVEDSASAVLRFESGAIGQLDVGFCYRDSSLAVVGSEGTICLGRAFSQDGAWDLAATVGEQTIRQSGRSERACVDMIEDFSVAVVAGRPAPIDALEGLRGLEVVEAIYESAQTGERVELKE